MNPLYEKINKSGFKVGGQTSTVPCDYAELNSLLPTCASLPKDDIEECQKDILDQIDTCQGGHTDDVRPPTYDEIAHEICPEKFFACMEDKKCEPIVKSFNMEDVYLTDETRTECNNNVLCESLMQCVDMGGDVSLDPPPPPQPALPAPPPPPPQPGLPAPPP